jgi:hypothetical protein
MWQRGLTLLFAILLAACGDDATPAADEPDAQVGPTWTSFAANFLETYCHECHGPGDNLRDFSLLDMVRSEAAAIRCGVAPASAQLADCQGLPAAEQFPIGGGPKPTEQERAMLVQWIDDGAPE